MITEGGKAMKHIIKFLYGFLFPGAVVVVLSVPISAGLLIYAFLIAGDDSPVAYVSYVLSAYSLLIVCIRVVPCITKWSRRVQQNPFVSQYREDIPFKMRMSLDASFVGNLLYAGVNAFTGICYHSPWFGSLAAYYICLSIMRFLLVRYAHRHGFGENLRAEWKWYRMCGVILIVMNLALAGLVILAVYLNEGFEYEGVLIYVMALYTFYITIMAVVNVVLYRKYHSPVMSAARKVSLAAALVSMLSLETAMLSQFDTGNTSPYFRQIMIGSTGAGVCAIVIGMGIFMMIHSTRQLRQNKKE